MPNNFFSCENMEAPDFYSPDFIPSRKFEKSKDNLSSPEKIYSYLSERVYKMEEAKKAVSMFIYKALKGINSEKVILIASESGTGKSHLISVLSEVVPNMVISDGSSMVPSGYKGGNRVCTCLQKLDTTSGNAGFVVIDEFNRLLSKGLGSWSDSSLLAELLVLFDDKDVKVNAGTEDKPCWVNPSKLFFILLGSWSDITDQKKLNIGFNANIGNSDSEHRPQITKEQILEELSQWPELVGRISRIIVNPNMTERDYYSMLKDPRFSPAARLEDELNIRIKISQKKMHEFAEKSYASGIGVRGAKNFILERVDEALFSNPDLREIYIR